MFLRLPLLLALLLSLALGPVRLTAGCLEKSVQPACSGCCGNAGMVCCHPAEGAPAKAPESVTPQPLEAKLGIPPQSVAVSVGPPRPTERLSWRKWQAARMPVAARVERTCIRLI